MKKLLILPLFLLLTSCIIRGNLDGITNDYNKLTAEQKDRVVPLEDFNRLDTLHIYKVSGQRLAQELKQYPKGLVYIFSNGCRSSYCLPMSNYENFARQNNYKLFLVMEGYGELQRTLGQRSEVFTAPLFSIDNDFYGSTYSVTYSRMFRNALRGLPKEAKPKWEGNLYYFENGSLVKISQTLEN